MGGQKMSPIWIILRFQMGALEKQLKDRAKDMKSLLRHGKKFVGVCKKGWHKLRNKLKK